MGLTGWTDGWTDGLTDLIIDPIIKILYLSYPFYSYRSEDMGSKIQILSNANYEFPWWGEGVLPLLNPT